MSRNKITGEPEAIRCTACGEYIPQGQAADILGQDVCSECEDWIMYFEEIDGHPLLLDHSTCGNYSASRTIENGYVLECDNCGDDEYEIAIIEDKQVP